MAQALGDYDREQDHMVRNSGQLSTQVSTIGGNQQRKTKWAIS